MKYLIIPNDEAKHHALRFSRILPDEIELDYEQLFNDLGQIAEFIVINNIPFLSRWFIINNLETNSLSIKKWLKESTLTDDDLNVLNKYLDCLLNNDFSRYDYDNLTIYNKSLYAKNMKFRVNVGEFLKIDTSYSKYYPKKLLIRDFIIYKLGYYIENNKIKSKYGGYDKSFIENSVTVIQNNKLLDNEFLKTINKIKSENKVIVSYLIDLHNQWRPSLSIRNIHLNTDYKTIKFLPEKKENKLKNYQSMKLGKLFSKLNITGLTSSEIENFVNDIASLNPKLSNFNIVEGEDIRTFYNENQYDYDSCIGSLAGSCMRYSKLSDLFDMYVLNPEVCKMLILKSNKNKNKIIGRALLWKADDGTDLMDRIYGSDITIKKFEKWASENNYVRKSSQGAGCYSWIYPNEVYSKSPDFTITLTNFKYSKIPYMDTFPYMFYPKLHVKHVRDRFNLTPERSQYGTSIKGSMTTVEDFSTGELILKQEANKVEEGYIRKDRGFYDAYTSEFGLMKDKVRINGYDVLKKNVATCEYSNQKCHISTLVEMDGMKIYKNLVVFSEADNKYILKHHAIRDVFYKYYFDYEKNDYIKFINNSGFTKYLLLSNKKTYEKQYGKIKKENIIEKITH